MGECVFTGRGGKPKKLPILNDNYPADINMTFIQGNIAKATFEARISEDGNPASYTYQWYVDNKAVSGANASSYVWEGTEDASHNIYCEVTNRKGTIKTRTASLKVEKYYLPTLNTSNPADVATSDGKEHTFSVGISAHGNPASYTYQWYVDDVAQSGATSTSFKVSNLSAGSHTVYCDVTNAAGTVRSRIATLNSLYTPTLNSSYPANVTSYRKNTTTRLVINIPDGGHGTPSSYTYQWYMNGNAISGATNWYYDFSLANNAGTYSFYCKVTNAAGTVQSRTATVTLQSETVYLYNAGTENVAWTYSNQDNGKAIVQNRDGAIEFYHGSWAAGGTGYMVARTTSAIDLTVYKKVCFEINITKVAAIRPWLGVTSNAATWNSVTWLAVYEDGSYHNVHTVTVDISSINQSAYVTMRHEGNAFVTKVYLQS